MAIRKILLQKKISNTLYDIYVKTDASIVEYTRGTGNDAVQTTVAAELAKIASDAADAVDALRTEIMGTGEIDEYFDTVKEIADWLQDTNNTSAATIVSDISGLKSNLGVASAPASGTEGQEGYTPAVTATGLHADVEALAADLGTASSTTPAVAATGLHADVEANAADIDALEAALGTSSDAAGNSTAFARIAALEAVGSTKVEDGYAASAGHGSVGDPDYEAPRDADPDGVIRVDGVAMVVYGGDPTVIDQDSTHRFVSDAQIASWDNCIMYTNSTSMTTYASNLQANALYLVDLETPISGADEVAAAFSA